MQWLKTVVSALNARRASSGLSELWRRNLRMRVALSLGAPLLLLLAVLAGGHYWREWHLLNAQAELTALQLGQVAQGSLYPALQAHNTDWAQATLKNIVGGQTLERAQLVDVGGRVLLDTATTGVNRAIEPGCMSCHRLAAGSRPAAVVVPGTSDVWRVAVPVPNSPTCATCHPAQNAHLAVLLVDVPLRILWPHVLQDLQLDLAIAILLTVLVSGGMYVMTHQLIFQRIEVFRRPLADYAQGDFNARLPLTAKGGGLDEIGQLALAFNRMADELERHTAAERERQTVRQRAIVEERERIARELHDGLAQVLGYVNTKATAVRLHLKKQQITEAEKHLHQLEDAARTLFVDVREAILGLRVTTGHADARLPDLLRDYAVRFSQLSDLPVTVETPPDAEQILFPPETELQVLRIVQEALANVRKHASASAVTVAVRNGGPLVDVIVQDNGLGFDLAGGTASQRPHFGLSTMRERAEAIGAEFKIESQAGQGTAVKVRLKLPAFPVTLYRS